MDTTTYLAIGALLTGVAGVITALAGLIRSRAEARSHGDEECERRLAAARAEAESYAAQLHEARMRED